MQVAIGLGLVHNAELTLLHVYPVSSKFSSETDNARTEIELIKVKEKMEKISDEISQERGLKISSVVLSGNIAEQLISYTKGRKFNLIIMGANSSDSGNSPGSHTIKAIEESSRPVMVVPNNYSFDD